MWGGFQDSDTGTTVLPVGIRGPGRLKLYGAEVVTAFEASRRTARFHGYGPLRLPVRPRGRALRELRQGKEVSLRVKLRYTPDGGLPRIRAATVSLRRTAAA